MQVPYDVVRRGVLSCNEQAPHNELSFLVAAGREYFVAFYDMYDDFVTSEWDVAAYGMKPGEQVIFASSHKSPYNTYVPQRVTVERTLDELWSQQMPSIHWTALSETIMPLYGGRNWTTDGSECAATVESSTQLGVLPDAPADPEGFTCSWSRVCVEPLRSLSLIHISEPTRPY